MSGFGANISELFFKSVFPVLFLCAFLIFCGAMVVIVFQRKSSWNSNNQSPDLSVSAHIVGKRTRDSGHWTEGNPQYYVSSTDYYVTFEVESEDQMEFKVHGREYGMLAEGDAGRLRFQGTRYLGFEYGQREEEESGRPHQIDS